MWAKYSRHLLSFFLIQYVVLGTLQTASLFGPAHSGGDFFLGYEATQRALAGANPYAPLNYLRPPFSLTFVVPFALLPRDIALLLWRLADSGFFIAALPLSLSLAREAGLVSAVSLKLFLGFGILWVFFAPYQHGVYSGQNNGLLLLCLVSSYLLWRRGHHIGGGLTFSITVLIKVYPVLLGLLWLRKGDHATLLWGVLGVLAGTLVTVLAFGPQVTLDYLPVTLYAAAFAGSAFQGNLAPGSAIVVLMRQLQLPGEVLASWAARVFSFVLALAGPVWISKRTQQPLAALEFAFLLTLMIIGGQLIEYHHLVFLLPVLLITFFAARGLPAAPWLYVVLSGGLELIQVSPLFERGLGFPIATGGFLLLLIPCWYLMHKYRRLSAAVNETSLPESVIPPSLERNEG